MPGQTAAAMTAGLAFGVLQWRAGQLPGQTSQPPRKPPSSPGFNGGPDNCPAKRSGRWPARSRASRFNGGPDNCPAKRSPRPPPPPSAWSFNGGPDNCPAKLDHRQRPLRAGHGASMEGRTIARPNAEVAADLARHVHASMEGRTIARPNQTTTTALRPQPGASMEGRTIARPNRSANLRWLTCPFAGVCERSRKLGLRRYWDSAVKLRCALHHKASSGPRDLPAHCSARIRRSSSRRSATRS